MSELSVLKVLAEDVRTLESLKAEYNRAGGMPALSYYRLSMFITEWKRAQNSWDMTDIVDAGAFVLGEMNLLDGVQKPAIEKKLEERGLNFLPLVN